MIEICKDYIHQHKSENTTLDQDRLMSAKRHQLEALVYVQTGNKNLKTAYFHAMYTYNNRLKIKEEISSLLESHQIPYFYVKGLEISKYYRDHFVKTMGDLDLIVHPEHKEFVADLLLSHGYRQKEEDRLSNSEWHIYKNEFLIELHHSLLYNECVNDHYTEYFSNPWKYVTDHKLDDSYHLLYLLTHLRKHLLNKGIGIRQILDIAMFSNADINWNFVKEQSKIIGLDKFTGVIYGLIANWWGLHYPMELSLTTEFVKKSTDMINSNGVFGTLRYNNSVINRIDRGQNIYHQVIHFLFPSYQDLMSSQLYNEYEGKKYLLPYIWVKRAIVHCKEFKSKITNYKISKREMNEYNNYLSEWGLKDIKINRE